MLNRSDILATLITSGVPITHLYAIDHILQHADTGDSSCLDRVLDSLVTLPRPAREPEPQKEAPKKVFQNGGVLTVKDQNLITDLFAVKGMLPEDIAAFTGWSKATVCRTLRDRFRSEREALGFQRYAKGTWVRLREYLAHGKTTA